MKLTEKILLSLLILILFSLFFLIVFDDNGLIDLNVLKSKRDRLIEENIKINMDNLSLYCEIDRLKHDLGYIEDIIRRELGLINENEVIFKFKNDTRHKVKK